MARQARRLINLVDDTPIVPGTPHPAFDGNEKARLILNDTEEELKNWRATYEPIKSSAGSMGVGGMPALPDQQGVQTNTTQTSVTGTEATTTSTVQETPVVESHTETTPGGVKIETT